MVFERNVEEISGDWLKVLSYNRDMNLWSYFKISNSYFDNPEFVLSNCQNPSVIVKIKTLQNFFSKLGSILKINVVLLKLEHVK